MPLFKCSKCGGVENTACSNYWAGATLCSACDPKIGKWHGLFPRLNPDDYVEGPDGFLVKREERAR